MDFLATNSTYSPISAPMLLDGPLTYPLAAILALLILIWVKPSKGTLPPTPGRSLPIIGHLAIMPRSNTWLTFTRWSRQLGPLFHVNLAGELVVILGTHKAAADLLDRRSAIYSDRARNIVAGKLLTGGLVYAFTSHNEVWKRMRRASHDALNATVSRRYHHMQETEAYLLAYQLLQKPEEWDNHLRRANASLVLSIIYGLPPMLDSMNPDIKRVNHFVERALAAAAPGAFLVEYFTWMEHLPRWMCAWRRYAEDWFRKDSVLFEKLFSDVEERMRQGNQPTSVASVFIENKAKFGMTDQEAAWCAATLYAAGGETTSSQMAWVILSMILYPEVQKKAQMELDRVVGRDRLPSFQDLDHLPYIHSILKEIMRWRGVGPLGIPHRLNTDDYYEGYYLPKDTIVVANAWALNHDPDVWGPDADDFKPERHLDDNGQLKPALRDTHEESHVTYGYGRRICVGRHVSNNSLLIQIASLLWAFDLSPCENRNGEGIPDPNKFLDEGLVVRPHHFPCVIEPRFNGVGEAILQTLDSKGQATEIR